MCIRDRPITERKQLSILPESYINRHSFESVSYTHLRAHETSLHLVCRLLLEKYIQGRELTVAVIEKDNKSIAIEVTEIISNMEFFNYNAKYSPGIATHILPAKIPTKVYEDCKEYAKIAHDTINCRGLSLSLIHI